MQHLTYAEVDLSAIRDNISAVRDRVGPYVRIMPAVKAEAYGHGAVPVSKACLEAGADLLCVANVDEAAELREAGVSGPILILGCSIPAAAEEVVQYDITSTVCEQEYAKQLSNAAIKQNKTAIVHIKVDTGMGRIGVQPEETVELARQIVSLPGLRLEGFFTHFPSSDEPERDFTLKQINTFKSLRKRLAAEGINIPVAHTSNSGGILAFPEADFEAVRPGIIVYGYYPSPNVPRSIPIRPPLTLKTHIVFLKTVPPGTSVSYGRTHITTKASKIATLPIGYADGYNRLLSNKGEAAVRGVRVPVIGRVCMDQIMIDVTDVPGVSTGDEVVLYGGGYEYLGVDAIASKIGTIPYEVLCAIGNRVARVYINA